MVDLDKTVRTMFSVLKGVFVFHKTILVLPPYLGSLSALHRVLFIAIADMRIFYAVAHSKVIHTIFDPSSQAVCEMWRRGGK